MRLAAFGDEITAGFDDQLDVLKRHGITRIDLRRADGTPVLDLSDAGILRLRAALADRGITVATIASPIGKEPADADPAGLDRRLARAAMVAAVLGTGLVRVFAFFSPAGPAGGEWLDCSLRSLRRLADAAAGYGITLLLENEQGTAADTVARARRLLAAVDSPHLQAVYDPVNALRCGEQDCLAGYKELRPWVRQLHVKDLDQAGRHVPAGYGRVGWPALIAALRRDGFAGIVSLEPHLASAGPAGGFTGPDLFPGAAAALLKLLNPGSAAPSVPSALFPHALPALSAAHATSVSPAPSPAIPSVPAPAPPALSGEVR
jgi:sugar phosphate isomerase/epimerase